jgi:hypothetical protein
LAGVDHFAAAAAAGIIALFKKLFIIITSHFAG